MRTTLTVETDLFLRLQDLARVRNKPFKVVVNETLRAGLERQRVPSDRRFSVEPVDCGFVPGVDIQKLSQYADQLEVDDFLAEAQPRLGVDRSEL